jgi:hypothetical protein
MNDDDMETFEMNQLAQDEAAEIAEANDDCAPFPWNLVKRKAPVESHAERIAKLRNAAEAEHIAAHAERSAQLLGLKEGSS